MVDEEMKSLIADCQAETILGLRTQLEEAERKLEEAERVVGDHEVVNLIRILRKAGEHGTANILQNLSSRNVELKQRATVAEAGEAALRDLILKAENKPREGEKPKEISMHEWNEKYLKPLWAAGHEPSLGKKIVEALEPFAKAADCMEPENKDDGSVMDLWDYKNTVYQRQPDVRLTYGDFRKAAKALGRE